MRYDASQVKNMNTRTKSKKEVKRRKIYHRFRAGSKKRKIQKDHKNKA